MESMTCNGPRRGAVFFGANLSGARVWQTTPSGGKAYTLAVLSDLKSVEPSNTDISRLGQTVEILKSWGRSSPVAALERLNSLLDRLSWPHQRHARSAGNASSGSCISVSRVRRRCHLVTRSARLTSPESTASVMASYSSNCFSRSRGVM